MDKKSNYLSLVIVLCAAAIIASMFITRGANHEGATPAMKETRLEQVKRTGVLRCGYVTWPPYLVKDPNTGKFSGAIADIVEEVGRQLNLKIEWTIESTAATTMADLNLNRIDMNCSSWAVTPSRAREGDFVGPSFYLPIYLYVRSDDARFDNNYDRANQSDIKFATIDGDFEDIIVRERFPNAMRYDLPQSSQGADLFMAVESKKADAVGIEANSYADYNKNNPGKIRPALGKPVTLVEIGMPIPANEPAFKAMLNTTIAYLHNNGFIERILDKYEGELKSVRAAKTYRE